MSNVTILFISQKSKEQKIKLGLFNPTYHVKSPQKLWNLVANFRHLKKRIEGFRHSFVVTTTGRVFAWGRNDNGQLGNGTTDDRSNPTLISFTDLQAGETI